MSSEVFWVGHFKSAPFYRGVLIKSASDEEVVVEYSPDLATVYDKDTDIDMRLWMRKFAFRAIDNGDVLDLAQLTPKNEEYVIDRQGNTVELSLPSGRPD